jgi:hypothetical protein
MVDNPNAGRYHSIKFMDLGANLAGVAIGMDNDDAIIIRISPRAWFMMTDNQRRWTVWHEMAHDVHNARHGTSLLLGRSVPVYVSDITIERVKKDYLKYLKENGK